ncbi:MAG: alpha/beta hydrolase [Thermoanaerobaculia bacterium]|nr:alpha/beta hydrolase [Thermoanaerobaculia bacterium]
MRLTLHSFASTDHLALPGLLYEPARASKKVAIWLHGNGGASVFYSAGRMNALGEALTRRGISFFTFNNRGAEVEKMLKRRKGGTSEHAMLGYAHELIRDCVKDIDGAIAHLRSLGYRTFHLVGHSTGANKICLYDAKKRRKNPVSSYVLLGPGDDVGISYAELGADGFHSALERARVQVARGHGSKIVPKTISPRPISWASLLDTIDPEGDYNVFPFLEIIRGIRLSKKRPLLREYSRISKRTLVVFGENDEFCFGDVPACVDVLREFAPPRRCRFEVIADTGHGFHDAEEILGERIAKFLAGK